LEKGEKGGFYRKNLSKISPHPSFSKRGIIQFPHNLRLTGDENNPVKNLLKRCIINKHILPHIVAIIFSGRIGK
jgi:hypothetical protein